MPVTEITAEDGQNLPPELLDGDFVKSELRYFLQLEGDIGYQGKLYVLTSRLNYSSAESFGGYPKYLKTACWHRIKACFRNTRMDSTPSGRRH